MTIAVNPFKSKPSFWIFINMMQILSYIPVIDCNVPSKLEYFLTVHFGLSKCSIPFDLLPSWMYNPMDFIAKFKTKSLSSRFESAGYVSVSFIYNFINQLITWIALTLIYFLVHVTGFRCRKVTSWITVFVV